MKAADVAVANEPRQLIERVAVGTQEVGFEGGDDELTDLLVERQLANPDVQVVITTGGTGISSRDTTYETVAGLLQKRLDGFGELFRMLSYKDIGSSAMMSRACAGLASGKIVVSLPGSEAAVRLAMERLLIPELGHLVREATR